MIEAKNFVVAAPDEHIDRAAACGNFCANRAIKQTWQTGFDKEGTVLAVCKVQVELDCSGPAIDSDSGRFSTLRNLAAFRHLSWLRRRQDCGAAVTAECYGDEQMTRWATLRRKPFSSVALVTERGRNSPRQEY